MVGTPSVMRDLSIELRLAVNRSPADLCSQTRAYLPVKQQQTLFQNRNNIHVRATMFALSMVSCQLAEVQT